jgi:hypothetical protein
VEPARPPLEADFEAGWHGQHAEQRFNGDPGYDHLILIGA